ncbi:Chemotaxis regulator BdlA [Salinivirga cyanobacteriivorans]|uniref:Chemotaxis regulator BdlA n=1 Tax=Salinivirga cyanobacteriivorans TaxID=1307839 RepID=A0A0S2I0R7_9BACT|nr:GAF domain-containing protein [Salinivirga cyanobacteriivorans]ALO15888.1 Chemotaxis regulator BdlA [Salinivirga cyanobacteriivorans]
MNQLKNIRFSLSIRLLIGVVLVAGIIYLITIRYINYDYKEVAIELAKKTAGQQAENVTARVKNLFEADFEIFRTYANTFEKFDELDPESYRTFFNSALERLLKQNPRYISVWDNWERQYIEPDWNLPYGRLSYIYFREGGFISTTIDTLDTYGDDTASLYYDYKANPREGITEPYTDVYSGGSGEEILMTSIIVPVMQDSSFVGMVGADISLRQLKVLVDSLNQNFEGYAYILSNKGFIVAHPNEAYLGKNFAETDSILNIQHNIIPQIRNGTYNKFVKTDQVTDEEFFTTIIPVTFGKSNSHWGIAINVPLQNIITEAESHFEDSRKVGIYGLIVLIIVTLLVAYQIIKPINKTTKVLQQLSLGEIRKIDNISIKTGDEIEQMSHSVNTVIKGFKDTVEFANQIKNGNFDHEFTPLSDKDVLGNAVLEMRNSLKEAKAEEVHRQKEEEQSKWASEGINLFGTILRQDNDNLAKLTNKIISTLVDYLGAHQGGLYLTEGKKDQQYLELVASIGFDKEKMLHKTIQPNEGVVGKCLLEKDRIYMDDIPEDHAPIISGLGNTKPGSTLVVPMIINEDVIGIIEIGSLNRMQEYQIQFVEKIGVSIASTISSAKINARTAELLKESKEQADELAQQEEEMRQNMEELQAMQEEATKRENKIQNFINAAKSTLLYIEYDPDGKITDINENMLHLFQLKQEQVINKQIGSYEFSSAQVKHNYEEIWNKLEKGQTATNNFYSKHLGRDFYLKEYYYPLINKEGKTYKVLNIAIDISEEKRKEKQLQELKTEYEKLVKKHGGKKEAAKKSININEIMEQEGRFEYIDLTHLRKVYKNDLRKIQNIISIYVDTIPKQLDELQNIAKSDLRLLRSKIGNFRTKMSYLGLSRVVEMAKKIETIAATGVDTENIEDLLQEIATIWKNAQTELEKIIVK